jgi:hypothetical protein
MSSPPRKSTDEEEAIPCNHTKMSWAAYKIADKHPYSTMFERFATCEHSQSITQLEMKAAFFHSLTSYAPVLQAENTPVDLGPVG